MRAALRLRAISGCCRSRRNHCRSGRATRTHVALVRAGGPPRRMRASPDPSDATKSAVDAAFRAKYGIVDWWYGLLLRREPIPVRLDPAPGP